MTTPGEGEPIGRRRARAPRPGVERPLCLSHDGITARPRSVLALVGGQGSVIEVARRIEPPTGDALYCHGVIDCEPAAGLEADALEPKIVGARSATWGDEELVADEHRASRSPCCSADGYLRGGHLELTGEIEGLFS